MVGGTRRKCCEWCNEDIKRHKIEKKELFEQYLQSRTERTYGIYRRKRGGVKRMVRGAKKEVDERWGSNLKQDFERNKKIFRKEMKGERKGNVGI